MTTIARLRELADIAAKAKCDCTLHGSGGYHYEGCSTSQVLTFDREWRNAAPAILAVLEAAQLKRNVLIPTDSDPRFIGEWIAVPRQDFEALREAWATLESGA